MTRLTRHPIIAPAEEPVEVSFRFDGETMQGRAGEMVSSALFANGVKTFSIHAQADTPQGIFCANGQCSQCTVVIDGLAEKACVTPLAADMDIRTLVGLPALPADDAPLTRWEVRERRCDVLVVGGGPSGLTAAVELGKLGLSVLVVEDKAELGGKLLLQTHKFFGSVEDCWAGTRGVDIARILEQQVRELDSVEVLVNASVVGIYQDHKAGVFVDRDRYEIVDFDGLVVSAGARERSLVFPGNDLPGVYGAGAFQTLVNRDLVKAADRVFIVGSGNVGLIAAYHALQAGIAVVGIIDILDRPAGYQVHADKIKRMGVPILLRHTIVSAEGHGRVERITVAEVDDQWLPKPQTAQSFAVDTLLIAAGLTPVDEYYDVAARFDFPVVKAGDAAEIAEASSAMFGGRLAGLEMAGLLGHPVEPRAGYAAKAEILKSHPGAVHPKAPVALTDRFTAVLHCTQEIPCDPCTSVCKEGCIVLSGALGTIMDVPTLTGECNGCGTCVAACPGLAITLAREVGQGQAEVIIAHELEPDFVKGDRVPLMDQGGAFVEHGEVLKMPRFKKHKTYLVRVRCSAENATRVAGLRVQDPAVTQPLADPAVVEPSASGIICRCGGLTLGEVSDYIREHGIDDVNQLKQARVSMGACGGKVCQPLLRQAFREAGVADEDVTAGTVRPLSVEVPMSALINERKR